MELANIATSSTTSHGVEGLERNRPGDSRASVQQSPSIRSQREAESTFSRRNATTRSQQGTFAIQKEQQLTKEELDQKPWKYIGYRGYSAYLASETDFLIFRRFRTSSARIGLMLQDKVACLEEELELFDLEHEKRESEDVHNGTFRDDEEARTRTLGQLKLALDEYYRFMLQQAELKSLPAAPKHDIESIQNWHWNHDTAINAEEQAYLDKPHDLFTLYPREKAPLRRLLERSKAFRVHQLWKKEKPNPTLPMYDHQEVTYTSDARVDKFVNALVVAIGMAMLIGPIWILNGLEGQKEKLATITGFIVLFLGVIGGATVAKIWEALAATAAYSAVLMVFMQLGTAAKG